MSEHDKAIILWLKETNIPLTTIASRTGVSRGTLYNTIKNSHTLRESNVNKILKVYSTQISWTNTTLKLKGGSDMNFSKVRSNSNQIQKEEHSIDANYVMSLQKNEITRLQQENAQLKANSYTVQSKAWDEIQYDFYSDIRITFVPFKRTVYSLEAGNQSDGVKTLAKSLKINYRELINEYFQIGKWHDFNHHPINALIEKSNLEELKKLAFKMPSVFDSLKLLVGEHYFQQIISYRNKENYIHSICNIKVHWIENPHRCECKTTFIDEIAS